MDSLYTLTIFAVLVILLAVPYWIRAARQRREAKLQFQKHSRAGTLTPVTLHPHINLLDCIGCGSCVKVCPEDVLGIVNGRAAVVNGLRCVGHALCADVCPVGAITLRFGTPKQGMEIPFYDEHYQSNIEGLYIVGELGGIGLIKNAVNQSIAAVNHLAPLKRSGGDYDLIIVGAGPAGLAAALAAHEKNLRYVVLEQDSIGGTISHYPRQKLVLTSPVELPLYGKLKVSEISKEELLGLWRGIVKQYNLNITTNCKLEHLERLPGQFLVKTGGKEWRGANVVLALGRRGSPRKLGVKGEDLPKVMYNLIEAERYKGQNILVVGGGDSAVEAAVGLARQQGNTVTISYRREAFVRLKERNEQRIGELIRSKAIDAVFSSEVEEIKPRTVVVTAGGSKKEIKNDYVFIFAGGELPAELLKKAGVRLRTSDVEAKAA
ncbi:MAG: NAD(P)-binding domain-containing protein [Bacteroidota bacterium]